MNTSLLKPYKAGTIPTESTIYQRNAQGDIILTTTQTGPMRQQSRVTYDKLGRVTSETNEAGLTTTYAYSSDGLTVTETTPAGATLTTSRHTDGSLIRETGTAQRNRYYSYHLTTLGIMTRERADAPDGPIIKEVIVNSAGQIVVTRTPSADSGGDMLEERNYYNHKAQIAKIERTGKPATLIQYHPLGHVAAICQKIVEGYTIDHNADRITTYDREYIHGHHSGMPLIEQIFDTLGNAVDRQTFTLVKETQIYNNPGYSAPLQTTTLSQISATSQLLDGISATTEANGHRELEYRLHQGIVKQHCRHTDTWEQFTTVTRVSGNTIAESNLEGKTTHYQTTWLNTGYIVQSTDPRGNTTTDCYDTAARIISQTDAADATVTTAYDPVTGEESCVTDTLGNETCFEYDHRGRKIAQYGSGVHPVKWQYDEDNRLIAMTTWREPDVTHNSLPAVPGDVTGWEYHNTSGTLLAKHYADNTSDAYTYDAWGQMTSKTNGNGDIVTAMYNPLNEELAVRQIGKPGTPNSETQTFDYDASGRLIQTVDAAGVTTYAYDARGHKIRETVVSPHATSELLHRYDIYGRYLGYTLTVNGTQIQKVDHAYDNKGRLSVATLDDSEDFTYGYDPQLGHHDLLAYPNGIEKKLELENSRNLINRLRYHNTGTAEIVYDENMTYNTGEQMTSRADTITGKTMIQNYGYNTRGEIALAQIAFDVHPAMNWSWQYDNIGNRVQTWAPEVGATESTIRRYQTNNLNQYLDRSNRYDLAGNKLYSANDLMEWEITYNAQNRAVSWKKPSWHHEYGEEISEMTYDYLGRRIDKKRIDTGDMVEWRHYIYNGYTLIAELRAVDGENPAFAIYNTWMWDSAQPVATRPLVWTNWQDGTWLPAESNNGYIHNPWQYRQGYMVETVQPMEPDLPTSGRYYYLHDHNKNVKIITDANAVIHGVYDYDPYGKHCIVSEGLARYNAFRFSSEYYDKELDLYYYNYRHYDPKDGRWLSRDPIDEYGGLNLYGFVGNVPSFKSDVLGLASIITDSTNGFTYWIPTDCCCEKPTRYKSLVKAVSKAKPDADGDITSDDSTVDHTGTTKNNPVAYGPNPPIRPNAEKSGQGNGRGRWIHGGGTALGKEGSQLGKQQLKPTFGCTRMHNDDVKDLGEKHKKEKKKNPSGKIPYERKKFPIGSSPEAYSNCLNKHNSEECKNKRKNK